MEEEKKDEETEQKPTPSEKPDEPKKKEDSEFLGQELEHPSIKEASKEEIEEVEKNKPVIIEWKKPFFITFALGVVAVALMYFLK